MYRDGGAVWTWRAERIVLEGPSGRGEQSVSCWRIGRLDLASRAYRAGGAVWTWQAERIVLENRPSEVFYLLIEGKQGKGKIKN